MTRVVRFHKLGGPEVLQFDELEVGSPGAGEIRIRVESIGLNRAEALFRAGHYLEAPQLPARIGYEGAGIVEELGEGVTGFNVGEPVCVMPAFSMNQYGVYAEKAIVPAYAVLKRPAGLGVAEASSIWMQYLTAYGGMIDITGLGKGDAVVITAASSSVGLAAIQIANAVGATPIAVTRGESKKAALLKAGAAAVVVSSTDDIAAEVMRITDGTGAKLVFDPVNGPGIMNLAPALGQGGMLMLYGNLSGEADKAPFPFRLSVMKGFSMRGYVVFEIIKDPRRLAKAVDFIVKGLESGTLKPVIDKVFPFERIADAHRYLESNVQFGKIVVTVP
jgi:NADPH:quinone reductase-like Zn-dependent oxidoreductase